MNSHINNEATQT